MARKFVSPYNILSAVSEIGDVVIYAGNFMTVVDRHNTEGNVLFNLKKETPRAGSSPQISYVSANISDANCLEIQERRRKWISEP